MPSYFLKDDDPSWEKSLSLRDWVIQMIQTGKAESPEFKAALNVFGRAKFETFWKEHRQKQKELKERETKDPGGDHT